MVFWGLAALAAVTVALALWRGARAEAHNPARGQLIDGVHVETYGDAAAPPVVLIHGASGSTYDMGFRLAPALADTFRVYVVDRPGFGHSAPITDESPTAQARAIRAAVAQIDPRAPLVAGQSYGGAVALAWALDAPDSLAALTLISAPSQVWVGGTAPLHRVLSTPVLGDLAAWLIAAYTPRGLIAAELAGVFDPEAEPEGYAAYFAAEMSLRPATHRLNARQRVALKGQIAAMVPAYPTLTVPIESVHGDADIIVPLSIHAEPLAAQVPTDVLTVLDGAGHMPHQTRTEAVTSAIKRAATRAALL